MKPLLEITHLKKTYGGRTVLDIQDLSLQAGQLLSVVGPSGSGKSTFLKLLNGIEAPDSGQVRFDGVPLSLESGLPTAVQRRMTLVFQSPVLFQGTVWDNVACGLKLRGISPEETGRRVEEALALVGLRDLAGRRAKTLSGGEAQRTALARALVLRPELLLLDEPTSDLDPGNVAAIEEVIRRAIRELGISVLLVTHNMPQARRLSDTVCLFLEGRVVERGTAAGFFGSPEKEITRAFVAGEMIC